MKLKTKTALVGLMSFSLASHATKAQDYTPAESALKLQIEAMIDKERFAKAGVQVIRIISRDESEIETAQSQTVIPTIEDEPGIDSPDFVYVVVQTVGGLATNDCAATFAVGESDPDAISLAFAGNEEDVKTPAVFNGPAMFNGKIAHGETASLQVVDLSSPNAASQISELSDTICEYWTAGDATG